MGKSRRTARCSTNLVECDGAVYLATPRLAMTNRMHDVMWHDMVRYYMMCNAMV